MIDKRLYQETFSHLRASDQAKQEVFQKMQEMKHRKRMPRVLRGAAIAAAMVMALAVTAGAVNVATDGEFFRQFTIVWTSGNQYLAQDNQGNEVYVTVAAGEPVTKENGRLILHAQGEEIDITEAMETAGAYHYAYDMDVVHEDGSRETRTVTIDVTGDLDRWTVSQDNGDGTSYETVSGDNGLTEFSGTMTGQAADHFTADLPDADESSVVEAKAQEIAPAEKRGQGALPVRVSAFLAETQQVVRTDPVVFAQRDQMMDRKLVGPALIAGVHRLGCSEHLSDLGLGLVSIFPQVPQNAYIIHSAVHVAPPYPLWSFLVLTMYHKICESYGAQYKILLQL